MLTRVTGVFRRSKAGCKSASSPAIIWGFTPKKTRSQLSATSVAVATRHESAWERASAFSGLRLETTIRPGSTARAAARARAPPMFPTPINPMVCSIYLTCPFPRITYLYVQSSSKPMGPRAWSFWVEMPISQPRPNSPPSVKRVEQFT